MPAIPEAYGPEWGLADSQLARIALAGECMDLQPGGPECEARRVGFDPAPLGRSDPDLDPGSIRRGGGIRFDRREKDESPDDHRKQLPRSSLNPHDAAILGHGIRFLQDD